MLTINLVGIGKNLVIFAIGAGLAYVFGFHLLFAHTAMEAIYWAGYYLGTYVVGNLIFNLLSALVKGSGKEVTA